MSPGFPVLVVSDVAAKLARKRREQQLRLALLEGSLHSLDHRLDSVVAQLKFLEPVAERRELFPFPLLQVFFGLGSLWRLALRPAKSAETDGIGLDVSGMTTSSLFRFITEQLRSRPAANDLDQ